MTATQILGLPISDEYKTPDGKTREDFERGALIYDESASDPWMIYFAAVEKELQAQAAQLAQAQAQVGQLQQQATLDAQVINQQKQQIDDLAAKVQELEAQLAAQPQPAPAPAPTPTPTPTPPTVTAEEIAAAAGQAFSAAFAAALQRTGAG